MLPKSARCAQLSKATLSEELAKKTRSSQLWCGILGVPAASEGPSSKPVTTWSTAPTAPTYIPVFSLGLHHTIPDIVGDLSHRDGAPGTHSFSTHHFPTYAK